MTSRNIRRANLRQEQQRETYAELSSVGFQTALLGTGEAWIGPILFGRAFVHPPQFSYSAVDSSGGTRPSLVKSLAWPHPSIVQANDSMEWAGWMCDPQFDMQMRWGDPYIPGLDDYHKWPGYQKVFYEAAPEHVTFSYEYGGIQDLYGYSDDPPGLVNWWVQGSGPGDRWSIVGGYPLSGRKPGSWSAQYVFGSETESRTLYPIKPSDMAMPLYGDFVRASLPDDAYERMLYTALYENGGGAIGAYPQGGLLNIAGNPAGDDYKAEVSINVSGACQLEVRALHWTEGAEWEVEPGSVIWHTELFEDVQVQDLSTGQNVVTFEFPIPSNLYPNWPNTDPDMYFAEGIYILFRVRILGGTPGLRVNLQRMLVWPDMDDVTSNPMITVGVAEWIIDNQGAYIGANLWAKTRDVTSATAGATVVSSPPGPCTQTRVLGDLFFAPSNWSEFVSGGAVTLVHVAHSTSLSPEYRPLAYGTGIDGVAGFVWVENMVDQWGSPFFRVPRWVQLDKWVPGWKAVGPALVAETDTPGDPVLVLADLMQATAALCETVNTTVSGDVVAVYPPYTAVVNTGDLVRFGLDFTINLENTSGITSPSRTPGFTIEGRTLDAASSWGSAATVRATDTYSETFTLAPSEVRTVTGSLAIEFMGTSDGQYVFLYVRPVSSGSMFARAELSNIYIEVVGT